MTFMRLPDWEPRLYDFIAAWPQAAISYGVRDCGVFAGGAVEAVTGHDPWAALVLEYDDPVSALKALKARGYQSGWHYLLSLFGKPSRAVFARRGDILYERDGLGGRMGVCLGARGAFLSAESPSLVFTPSRLSPWVFHVG